MSSFPSGQPQVESKRILCGVLAIVLGGLGVHRFILGDVVGGILRIVITVATCGFGGIATWIWAIIEAITVTKDANGVDFK